MKTSRTIHTANGSTVTVSPRGIEVDLWVRDAAGRTVATVEMSRADALALLDELDEVTA
ncbi:hypothetical protein [Streptomyces sp. NRRL F-5630]|uniref:hypothetical protein n=1 Tax=Streptomyces sp. NRRL F-5630 TaxID=1463864 RepID=UPI000AD998D9|nr:hypothetical protein [Streptomyces sp. NRRL F-5630]